MQFFWKIPSQGLSLNAGIPPPAKEHLRAFVGSPAAVSKAGEPSGKSFQGFFQKPEFESHQKPSQEPPIRTESTQADSGGNNTGPAPALQPSRPKQTHLRPEMPLPNQSDSSGKAEPADAPLPFPSRPPESHEQPADFQDTLPENPAFQSAQAAQGLQPHPGDSEETPNWLQEHRQQQPAPQSIDTSNRKPAHTPKPQNMPPSAAEQSAPAPPAAKEGSAGQPMCRNCPHAPEPTAGEVGYCRPAAVCTLLLSSFSSIRFYPPVFSIVSAGLRI